MTAPEAFPVTTSADDSVWAVDRYHDGAMEPWGSLEQDPATGEWWATMTGDDTTTTGPFLDEVQAMRALQSWGAP